MTDRHDAQPPAHYVADDEVDLIELGIGLWARRALIAGITLAVTALFTLYALLATPTYEATAEVRPQAASALAGLTENDLLGITPQTAFDRGLAELQSSALQARVADSVIPGEAPGRLQSVFRISTTLESRTINGVKSDNFSRADITASHSRPETAAALANTLVERANRAAAESLVAELQGTAAARLQNLQRDIERRREATQQDTEIRIARLQEEDQIRRQTLRDRIEELRTKARNLREDRLTRLREAREIAERLEIAEPRMNEFQSVVNIDTSNRSVTAERSGNLPLYTLGSRWLAAEIATLEAREGDDHDTPEIRELEQQLAELEVNEEVEVLKAREDYTPFIPGISTLLSQASQLKAMSETSYPNLQPMRMDRLAQPPESPVAPRRTLIVALGVMLGGMIGIFVALIVNAVRAREPGHIESGGA
jgi:LPS O-antigen subunit length determinant protein (WzzB/FepE family)